MSTNPKHLLQKYQLHPKKPWGQNFLIDPSIVERIVNLLGATAEDHVVELGAGTGALTFLLAQRAGRVSAIERDRDLVALLEQEFRDPHVQIIAADAAHFSLQALEPTGNLLVIGNLPYNITAPILFHLHEQRAFFRRAVLMIQKEVADRMAAHPSDGKDYSILSVLFGAYFSVEKSLTVSSSHFFPRPKVDSTVITLEPLPVPRHPIHNQAWFERTVKVAFAQRRKTLANNLRSGFSELERDAINPLLEALAISPQQRGETLTIAQFAQLSNALEQHLSPSTPLPGEM